jgi:hypothetical protein
MAALLVTVDEIQQTQDGDWIATLVLDDGQQLTVALDRLPEGTTEGTVLQADFHVSADETERRRNEIKQVQSRLFGHRTRASDHDQGDKT